MRFMWKLSASLAAIALSLALAPPVYAQTEEDTVLVTGQRQAYRGDIEVRETPQSITVIDSELFEDIGATRLTEALDLSAGLARQNNFGGLWDNFAVRGFAGDENLPSGYLVNGFNAGRGFGGPRDASGIERVEILKGPNAALFGRGEPGGTINIVTKKPEFETEGEINLSAGSFDTYRASADWTGPINDALAVRANGFYEDAGSFRDTLNSTRYGFMPSVLLRMSDRASLTYELELTRQEIPFDRGVVAVNNQLGVVPIERFLGEPTDGPLQADATGHQLEFQMDFNADWNLLLGAGYRETELEGFSTEAELAAGRQRLFSDGQTLSRQRRFRDYEADYTVLRAELGGRFMTGPLEHRILVGVDNDRFENSLVFLRFRPAPLATQTAVTGNVINIFNPVYGARPAPALAPQLSTLEKQEGSGLYFQDQIRLTEQLQVRIGGRYDDFEQEILNRANGSLSTATDSKFSPQVGLVFDATDAVTLFAAYGEGFRQNSGVDFAGRAFSPEESESFEAGARIDLLDGDLTASIAYFSMTKANILTADPVNSGFSLAIGEAESQGVEIDVQGELPGDVEIWASYAYVDAQVSKNALEPNFAGIVRAGDRLINVPENTLSLLASKDFEIGEREFELGGGLHYVGKRLGETATTFELPDYTTLRAWASYDLTDGVELTAEVNNLTDEEYYTNSYARVWVAPGAPRNFTLTLNYEF